MRTERVLAVWTDGTPISPVEAGYALGAGVFESMAVVRGLPVALSRHLRRMAGAAQTLALAWPGEPAIRRAAHEVWVAAGRPGAARLRIQLAARVPGPAHEPDDARLVVTIGEAPVAAGPVDVITGPWVRNERSPVAGLKTTGYAENRVALRAAVRAGASDVLFGNAQGCLAEATTSNVVVGRGARLSTPPVNSGCLPGIARELALECADECGVDLVEESITMAELHGAEAVLLTNGVRGVRMVGRLDGRRLPGTAAARRLCEGFPAVFERAREPWGVDGHPGSATALPVADPRP